jgi:thiol-disulfide isomerase/thioredoxin
MKRIDQIIVGLIVALAIALVWVVAGTLEPTVISSGDKAPGFTVVTDRGKTISPSKFDGKLLVLNFWATWCEGCVKEIQSLDAFQREFASQGVVVLGVSMDRNQARYDRFLRQIPDQLRNHA